jgi:hypothetical protein
MDNNIPKTKQAVQKGLVLEQLKKIPIVQAAVERVGISRATFYNWKTDDSVFAQAVEDAMGEGVSVINDLTEGQVLSLIQQGKLPAHVFWLKHNHPKYGAKQESVKRISREPSEEQKRLIEQALRFADLNNGYGTTN